MKRPLILIVLLNILAIPVRAQDLTAPAVPESAEKFMPSNQQDFGSGLLEIFRDALLHIRPDLKDAVSVCTAVIAAALCVSVFHVFPGAPDKAIALAGNTGVAFILLRTTGSLINLAGSTITEISEYGKLLLPVMTAALAGQGGVSASAAIYTATAFFDALLTALISKLLMPMVYFFLTLAVANSAIGDDLLKKLRDSMKWLITWLLKTTLYVFTGYIGITGVITGTTDAAALKAAKLTISGVVPVVGSILADASETVLISAATVKNASGVYGLWAILAIWLGPFLQIGSHYLLMKATATVCASFAGKSCTELILDFSSALGLLLAMTAAICVMLLVSIVCFLKGVG